MACPYFCGPGQTEGQVVIYGGSKKHISADGGVEFVGIRDLTVLSFGISYTVQSIFRSARQLYFK